MTTGGQGLRLGEALQVTVYPEHANAVPLNHADDDQRHGQRLVQIRVGSMKDRKYREWKDLEPVRDEDVQEERHRERDDEQRIIADVGADQRAQLVIAEFKYRLDLAGLAFLQLRADPEGHEHRDDDRDHARDHAVVVESA